MKILTTENGEPFRVFHGTTYEFESFGIGRGAIYFTDDPNIADSYSGDDNEQYDTGLADPNIIPAFLGYTKSLTLDEAWAKEHIDLEDGRCWVTFDECLYKFQESGYDLIILKDVVDFTHVFEDGVTNQAPMNQYIVFSPKQVKSALMDPALVTFENKFLHGVRQDQINERVNEFCAQAKTRALAGKAHEFLDGLAKDVPELRKPARVS